MALSKAEKRKMCAGCRDDFYNGNNDLGVSECWMLKSARVVTRTQVGTWDNPPYRWRPQKTLNCHNPKGLHWLRKEDVRVLSDKEYERVMATPESREAWFRA